MNRRSFVKAAGGAAAVFNIVPSHVLGQSGQVAPNSKLTIALIGCGTQGLRELPGLLSAPEVQVVAVCDPNKDGADYLDWSRDGLRKSLANLAGKPDWRDGKPIPGGRDAAAEITELYYANKRAADSFKGVARYADFRELLEKEKGLDAVKIMTPDHLHAAVSIAAMKAGKRVILHKPLANRLAEARKVIETARQTGVATHFIPATSGSDVSTSAQLIRGGAIGKLLEIHNWSNRPVWPQVATLPTDTPPVPKDFIWDLWLGPSLDRPYHPAYTHMVFRGWYEFGGGAIADMGHYSLCRVFAEFGLDAPVLVESTPSHVCALRGCTSAKVANDFSFPAASTVRFKFAAKGERPALDLFWYDGGMRPRTPEEVERENGELAPEGMLFVGEKGKILADFRGEKPRILSGEKVDKLPAPVPVNTDWVKAFQGGAPTCGDFLKAGPISDAMNLAAISLRLGGKRLLWDAANMKITNRPEAEKYLTREYRKGWEI
jgi:predicted dehydrogenase